MKNLIFFFWLFFCLARRNEHEFVCQCSRCAASTAAPWGAEALARHSLCTASVMLKLKWPGVERHPFRTSGKGGRWTMRYIRPQGLSNRSNHGWWEPIRHKTPTFAPCCRFAGSGVTACLSGRCPPERAFLGALAGFVPEGAIMRRQGSICACWPNGSPLWGYLRGRAEGVRVLSTQGCGPIK